MFWVRLGPLMVSQIRLASATASLSVRVAYFAKYDVGVAEGGLAQPQEAVDVPLADVPGRRVDVHREVEEVADREPGAAVRHAPAPAAAR